MAQRPVTNPVLARNLRPTDPAAGPSVGGGGGWGAL